MTTRTVISMAIAITCLLSPVSAQAIDDNYAGPPPPAPPQVITRATDGGVTVRAVRIPEPVVVDGKLDDPYYTQIPAMDGFIQQEPVEGEPATEKTEAWIFFDDKNLYISARMWDSAPDRIVANEMRRDHQNISRGASFAVVLDTFYDRRNGFYFETNPLGAIRDGLITNESDMNSDWNTVWNANAAYFAGGWVVEITIPFRSLRYRQGASPVWGIQLKRAVTWKNEDSYLTRVPASWEWRGIRKLSSAATLVGLQVPSGSKNIEVKPYGISGTTTDRTATPSVENDFSADVGLDAKYGVIVARTFSKAYGMAGLRIGYAIGHADTIKTIQDWNGFELFTNFLAMTGAMAALGQEGDALATERERNEAVRNYTREFFASAGFDVSESQTNFLFVDVNNPIEEFAAACKQEGVRIGRPFPPFETHARISLGTMAEMEQATKAFAKVLGVSASKAA